MLAERLETVRTLATENLEELFLGLSLESRAPIGFLNGLEKANDRTICMRTTILCYCVTLEATPRVESTMILIFEGVVVRSLTGFHFGPLVEMHLSSLGCYAQVGWDKMQNSRKRYNFRTQGAAL